MKKYFLSVIIVIGVLLLAWFGLKSIPDGKGYDTFLSVFSGILTGLISGLVVGVVLYHYQKRDIKREEKFIDFDKHLKILPHDVLSHLYPGISTSKVAEVFGPCWYLDNYFFPFGDKESKQTNAYTYRFVNAKVFITSDDNVKINTITIIANTESQYKIQLPLSNEDNPQYFGEKTVDEGLLSDCKHTKYMGMREYIWCVTNEWNVPGIHYTAYNYLGFNSIGLMKYDQTNNPNDLIGSTIDGICISNSWDEDIPIVSSIY